MRSPGEKAVIAHTPTPLMLPLVVQGPDAVKLTGIFAEEDALKENELPYCAFCRSAKVIVCDRVPDPVGRTMNVPDTAFATLKVLEPGCDAVTVQLPVALRDIVAEETLFTIDWLPTLHDPAALKSTCNPFGTPPDRAVAVIVGGFSRVTELGKGPRLMLWSLLSTAGGEGGLWREAPMASGTRMVDTV